MTTAIIVAAGTGSRFKSTIPKQFMDLAGKSVVAHAIDRFQDAPSINAIVVVLAEDRVADFHHTADKLFAVVAGGATRAESVMHGLDASGAAEIVAVHDGARPFVPVDDIERTVAKAKETGAACLVARVTDTIKSIRGGEIADTLDRDKLRRALTPQAFRKELLQRAFELGDLSDVVTDECYLVEKLGHPIAIVEGSPNNIKITHPDDLAFAGLLAKSK